MRTKKIMREEISDFLIANLPTRPTAEPSLGGRGYSARDMKEAFDKLPLCILDRFNCLIDDVSRFGEGSLAGDVPTGISEGHTLSELFSDITSGVAASYIKVMDKSLHLVLSEIILRLEALEERMDKNEQN